MGRDEKDMERFRGGAGGGAYRIRGIAEMKGKRRGGKEVEMREFERGRRGCAGEEGVCGEKRGHK